MTEVPREINEAASQAEAAATEAATQAQSAANQAQQATEQATQQAQAAVTGAAQTEAQATAQAQAAMEQAGHAGTEAVEQARAAVAEAAEAPAKVEAAVTQAESKVEAAVAAQQAQAQALAGQVEQTANKAVDDARALAAQAQKIGSGLLDQVEGLVADIGRLGGGGPFARAPLAPPAMPVVPLSVSAATAGIGRAATNASQQVKPTKAQIINLEKNRNEAITCLFNPREYTIAKKNGWALGKANGRNVPEMEFGGGEAATLSLQLLFDTYTNGEKSDDVRKLTGRVWNLMLVDKTLKDRDNTTTKQGRPPTVRFQWGLSWFFDAVITSITQKFVLFLENGTPVRATLDVTFTQVKDDDYQPPQNPTSAGAGGERMWTVREGDSLTSIAYDVYGDSTRWRPIADANRLDRVRRLRPGTVLEIPTRA